MDISVIITTYKRPQIVKRAIKSVVNQTYSPNEFIIVEDASDSGIDQWLQTNYPEVKYHKNKKNLGLAASRNKGIELSKSDWIAFLDDDDEWLPNRLEEQVSCYNSLSKEEKKYHKGYYKTVQYQVDSYVIFIERSNQLLCQRGLFFFIIPNTWLTNITYNKIREYLTKELQILEIVHFEQQVFKNATVDTELLLTRKEKDDNHNNQILVKIFENGDELKDKFTVQQKSWMAKDGDPINLYLKPELIELTQKIGEGFLLKEKFEITQGVKPFQKGKGKPKQTKKIVKEKPFVSDKKEDESFKPLLAGKLIERYGIRWDEDYWISYGDWLAEPRYSADFDADEKLVVRQTGDRLILSYDDKQFIVRDNLYVITPKDPGYDVKYLLGLMNSRLLTWYYQNALNPEVGEALAQVKKSHLVKLPIKESPSSKKKIESLVDQILAAKKEDPEADTSEWEAEIDRHVYQLYDLTDQEIAIVEESVG